MTPSTGSRHFSMPCARTPHVGLPGAMTVVWSATWFRAGTRCSRGTHHRRLQSTELVER